MITKDKEFYKSFLILCITLMLEQAVILSVNLADNIMLGNYSESALSGVAAVNQIQFVLQQIVYGISNGVIVLGCQYFGQGKREPVKKLALTGFYAEMFVAFALFAAVAMYPHYALKIFTNDTGVINEGVKYIDIIKFTYPVFACTAIMLASLRIMQCVKIALVVSVISLCVNCCVNYILIFGNFGMPEMGVRGAAIGTLTARILECIIVFSFIKLKYRRVKIRKYLKPDKNLAKDYFKVCIPIVLSSLMWGVSNAVQTVILGHMDTSAMAAYSISSTLFLLLKVTSVGAASAASVLIGQEIGRGGERIKEYSRSLQLIFICIGVILGISLFTLKNPMLRLYNISDKTRELANAFFTLQSIVIMTMSYQMPVNIGIIRGGGDTKYVMILDFISIWLIVMPLSLYAAFGLKASAAVVVGCLNSDQVFKCIPAAIYVNFCNWQKKLTRN